MFAEDAPKKNVKTARIVPEVWHNGEFVAWDDARVHVMSHVLHYGSSVFEGIRCYNTKRGPAIYRLRARPGYVPKHPALGYPVVPAVYLLGPPSGNLQHEA